MHGTDLRRLPPLWTYLVYPDPKKNNYAYEKSLVDQ